MVWSRDDIYKITQISLTHSHVLIFPIATYEACSNYGYDARNKSNDSQKLNSNTN